MNARHGLSQRRGMALMAVVVLVGVMAILASLAVHILLRTRLEVHRRLNRVQARWLAQAGIAQVIAAHLDGAPTTRPGETKPDAPDTLGVPGAELVRRVTVKGTTCVVRCTARVHEPRGTFRLEVGLDLRDGHARVVTWDEH